MGQEMNAMPSPNLQPEWVNENGANQNLDSSGNYGRTIYVDLNDDENLRATGFLTNPANSFFEASWVANTEPNSVFHVISPNFEGVAICPKHGTTVRETVSFNVNGHVDIFCIACIVDLIKERLLPINQSTTDSTSSPQEPVQRLSRYDLLKGKDATNI
jgi:hypothetical protein